MGIFTPITLMSNLEQLTKDEKRQALLQGWELGHVFDLGTSKWSIKILGMPSAEIAGAGVVTRARMGDALCLKALRLVMASQQGERK